MKKYIDNLRKKLNSKSGRDTLTFMVFLVISGLFWFVMTLNDEVQRDYSLRVSINALPHDITLLAHDGDIPTINVSVKDKGGNLISKRLTGGNVLKIDYSDFTNRDDNRLLLSQVQLNAIVRQQFSPTASIVSITPDSLVVSYTTLPPVKARVVLKSDIHTKSQFTVSGRPNMSTDSVLLYYSAPDAVPPSDIYTEIVALNDLNDTVKQVVSLKVPEGYRAVPDVVTVTIPVEPLVYKSFDIPVEVVNAPDGMDVITFPATVKFECLVPMSMFNNSNYPVKAYADFDKHVDNTIDLELSILPDSYFNGSVSPHTVEYVIEQK